jgi:hypothetical protein
MVLIVILLAVAIVGVLASSLLGLVSGTFDVVSIIGAVICVVAALAIGVEVLGTSRE